MVKAILILSALLASTCELGPFPKPAPEPEPPSPWGPDSAGKGDAGPPPVVEAGTPCARACARLAALGCPEAQPTPRGASCTAVCDNAESSGVVSFAPECVARAASCSAAQACHP